MAKTYIGFKNNVFDYHHIEYDELFWKEIAKGKNCLQAHVKAFTITHRKYAKDYRKAGKPVAKPILSGTKRLKFQR